MAEVYLDI